MDGYTKATLTAISTQFGANSTISIYFLKNRNDATGAGMGLKVRTSTLLVFMFLDTVRTIGICLPQLST